MLFQKLVPQFEDLLVKKHEDVVPSTDVQATWEDVADVLISAKPEDLDALNAALAAKGSRLSLTTL